MTPASGPHSVHAMIVGIESCALGPDWNLPGPAADALRFHDWLRDRGVPDANIRLHLAPAEPPARSADLATLLSTLTDDLPTVSSRHLWVFLGGHGFLDTAGNLRLLAADATARNPRNLDVDAALAYFTSTAVPGHPHQTWITDACATFVRELRLPVHPPGQDFPTGDLADLTRRVDFRAVRRGRRTANDPEARTGHFSRAVLRNLAPRPDAEAPLDTVFLDAVDRTLRSGGPDAEPAFYRLTEPGRVLEHGSSARPPVPAADTEIGTLVRDLCARPWATDATARQSLVEALGPRLATQVPRSPTPRGDLVGLVLYLRKVEGGLSTLRAAIALIDGSG